MKKLLYILLLAGCFLLMWACSSSSPPEAGTQSVTSQEKSSEDSSGFSKAYASSGKQPKIYTNQELGFSFTIPQEWSADEYKIVVSHGEQEEDESSYSQIDFIFRSDRENPLLRIYVVTSQWWGEYGSSYDSSLFTISERPGIQHTVMCSPSAERTWISQRKAPPMHMHPWLLMPTLWRILSPF